MAVLLLEGAAGLRQFTDSVVSRSDVRELMERVEFGHDPQADESGYDKMTSIIRIHVRSGEVYEARADYGYGSPMNPMSDDDLIEKFLECLKWSGMPENVGHQAAARLLELEEEQSVREIMTLFSSTARKAPCS